LVADFRENSKVNINAKDKVNINAKDKSGRTALDQAKDAEVKALLVAAGARDATPSGITSTLNADLFGAAERGDAAAVQALLAQGADVNARAGADTSALSVAYQSDHREVVQTLRDAGAKDDYLLIPAARGGDVALVHSLLAEGANVNIRETGFWWDTLPALH
jgi:ankyrin repeat protein